MKSAFRLATGPLAGILVFAAMSAACSAASDLDGDGELESNTRSRKDSPDSGSSQSFSSPSGGGGSPTSPTPPTSPTTPVPPTDAGVDASQDGGKGIFDQTPAPQCEALKGCCGLLGALAIQQQSEEAAIAVGVCLGAVAINDGKGCEGLSTLFQAVGVCP